jgi:epoxyqueuosine reductase QueG
MNARIDAGLSKNVKRFARSQGADLVRFARAASFEKAPDGHRPMDLLKGARSVIVIAIALPIATFESAPSREYSISYVVANRELDRIAFRIAKYLQDRGYRALHVPASPPYDLEKMMGDLSHKHASHLAGIGVFGKNSLILSPKYGGRIRLASIITDAPLETDKMLRFDLCKNCVRCIRACPARALKGDGIVDKLSCDRRHIEISKQLQLGDWEDCCGVCIRVCPIGRQ